MLWLVLLESFNAYSSYTCSKIFSSFSIIFETILAKKIGERSCSAVEFNCLVNPGKTQGVFVIHYQDLIDIFGGYGNVNAFSSLHNELEIFK